MFPDGLPLARPRIADPGRLARELERIVSSEVLTNGPTVERLEARAADYLGVRHCIAVASCTTGLMLVLRAAEVSGDVIVPSFTFAATAHAVAWSGLRPVFADVDPETLTLSPLSAERAIGVRTSAILATHIFGAPCDVEGLAGVARRNGISLFFDAAHGFGAKRAGTMVGGSGAAEVFSLTPTKTLIAGEGGIIATNDDLLAERCRIGRNYGNPGDYDCRFVGLNGRMSELHAAVALASFDDLEERIARRNELAARYREVLATVPGVEFPLVRDDDRSTYKDLSILVDDRAFGLTADGLAEALEAEGIETRRYYAPPVHRMRSYRAVAAGVDLPVTDAAAAESLSIPLWTDMTEDQVAQVGEAIRTIGEQLGRVGAVTASPDD
ncbi:MAG TPA: DegT/DnrJ/EryC1/StrS family aminotransferase [Actinomycetota bacterium]|jgi:dTDP-4-amino-4,6-dideoxygalactose transaminase